MSHVNRMRKRLFVDPKVQGALVVRVLLYWIVCLITITLMLLCWSVLRTPRMFYTHLDDMWFHYGPAMVASFLLLPMVVVDIIRLSNRFAGPLLRLRRSMRALARGEHVKPIHFREGDFWQEFADEFNALLARVQGETHLTEPPCERDEWEDPEPVGAAG
ncbi:MAG: hypothetical protein A2V98_12580 [Planctomycetes bacterium RBG_16_64_12]|nr:MAG: hypothetical protein A2V98_12580 [Planctomycetes bacterium RBG_16_64_12]